MLSIRYLEDRMKLQQKDETKDLSAQSEVKQSIVLILNLQI